MSYASWLPALLLAAGVCRSQPLASPVAGRWGGELTVSQRAEPRTFNPVTAMDNPSRELIRLFLSDLVHINRETLRTEPALADSWQVAPGGRSLTVRLRDGVTFSDGVPVTADDVLFSFQVYADAKVGSPQRDLLLAGGQPVAVTALDRRRVRFTFAEPYGPAERLLDSVFILPRHKLEAAYRGGKLTSVWGMATAPEELAGTGPFRLVRYTSGDRAVFERNPRYWKAGAGGRRLPFLDRVTIKFVADAETEVLRFRSGSLDMLTRIPAASFARLKEEMEPSRFAFHDAGPSLEYHFLFFNQNTSGSLPEELRKKQKWFRDAAFRRAVSAGVDREAIRRLAFSNRAVSIWQPVSPARQGWFRPESARPAFSSAQARQLLAAAGYRWNAAGDLLDGEGTAVAFTVAANAANAEHRRMATLLEQDLRELGIRAQVAQLEFRSLVDRILRTRDYDAAIMALAAGDADPGAEMSVWLSSGQSHFWNLNPARLEPWELELDDLMRRQMSTVDQDKRRTLYWRVQEIAERQMPLICLAAPNLLTAARAGLRNVRRNLLPPYALANVEELYWENGQ